LVPTKPLVVPETLRKLIEILMGLWVYSVNFQYLKKFSYGLWDNQWFGRNQIYLKLKLETLQFMPGIKNLNLKIQKKIKFLKFKKKIQKKIQFFLKIHILDIKNLI
jgi:hypothetical protein